MTDENCSLLENVSIQSYLVSKGGNKQLIEGDQGSNEDKPIKDNQKSSGDNQKPSEDNQGSRKNDQSSSDSECIKNSNESEVFFERFIIEYDPEMYFENRTTTSDAYLHFIKGSIGTGILALPDAFKNVGIMAGAFCTIIIGIICTHCMHMLLKSSRLLCIKYQMRKMSYADVTYMAFQRSNGYQLAGKWIKSVINGLLCLTQFGFCCVYFVFVTISLYDLGKNHFPNTHFWYYAILVFMVLIFLCSPTILKNIHITSQLATCFTFISFGIILFYILRPSSSNEPLKYFSSWSEYPVYFGTAVFAFEGIGLILPLQSSMANPDAFSGFFGILSISMGIVTILYIFIGISGYLQYRECSIFGSITLNLPKNDFLANVARLCMALGVLLTYPIQFYVPYQIIILFFKTYIHEYIIIVIFVTLTCLLAILLPNLADIISLIGASCGSLLALIIPPIIELATLHLHNSNKCVTIIKDIIILILGIISSFFGAYSSLINIRDKYKNSTEIFYNCINEL